MAKNIVICCDGTGNEIEANLSNVLKLFRVALKSGDQIVYYDPGIGTVSSSDAWSRLKANTRGVFGLLVAVEMANRLCWPFSRPLSQKMYTTTMQNSTTSPASTVSGTGNDESAATVVR